MARTIYLRELNSSDGLENNSIRVGYGASFEGLTALLAMLNSCASGVSAVNIDNGFGAAYQASLINRLGPRDDAALNV